MSLVDELLLVEALKLAMLGAAVLLVGMIVAAVIQKIMDKQDD